MTFGAAAAPGQGWSLSQASLGFDLDWALGGLQPSSSPTAAPAYDCGCQAVPLQPPAAVATFSSGHQGLPAGCGCAPQPAPPASQQPLQQPASGGFLPRSQPSLLALAHCPCIRSPFELPNQSPELRALSQSFSDSMQRSQSGPAAHPCPPPQGATQPPAALAASAQGQAPQQELTWQQQMARIAGSSAGEAARGCSAAAGVMPGQAAAQQAPSRQLAPAGLGCQPCWPQQPGSSGSWQEQLAQMQPLLEQQLPQTRGWQEQLPQPRCWQAPTADGWHCQAPPLTASRQGASNMLRRPAAKTAPLTTPRVFRPRSRPGGEQAVPTPPVAGAAGAGAAVCAPSSPPYGDATCACAAAHSGGSGGRQCGSPSCLPGAGGAQPLGEQAVVDQVDREHSHTPRAAPACGSRSSPQPQQGPPATGPAAHGAARAAGAEDSDAGGRPCSSPAPRQAAEEGTQGPASTSVSPRAADGPAPPATKQCSQCCEVGASSCPTLTPALPPHAPRMHAHTVPHTPALHASPSQLPAGSPPCSPGPGTRAAAGQAPQ
jgi:hypothetical protein